MAQFPDPTDPSKVVQSALGGVREALKAGRDIKETAKEVNTFLDEEAKARVAWKKRQQEVQRRGDMIFMDAVKEYRIIRQIRDAEAQMYKDIEREFGKPAVSEVKSLIVRLRRDHRELNDEFYRKRMEARKEWGTLLVLSIVIYVLLKLTGAW
jgi:hypothetical protein